MSTAPSPSKRERDDDGVASSEEDYFTPDSSASPGPSKKPKSPTSLNESGDHESIATPSATKAPPAEASECASQSEQLEWIFKNLRLRRIVKENHSSEINQLAFCLNQKHNKTPFGLDHVKVYEKRGAVKRDPMDNSNVLGTTGGPQANIYDNEHCGDHLDIMSHFLLDPIGEEGDEELPEMLTCCWIHQPQDAILVTAGTDKIIHVLSLARSKELMRLSGHNHTVTDIQAHPAKDEYLLSASKDGTVRMWNTLTGICLVIFEYKASVVCFNPGTEGNTFVTGGYNGEIREWTVPAFESEPEEPIVVPLDNSRVLQSDLHSTRIDCIRFAKGKALSKSVNGKVEHWDPETLQRIRTFNIKNTASNQCRFDVSLDELFFCVGTSNGSVYVYNIDTGRTVTELKHRRSTKAIRTCIFSRDCRTVVCAGEDSFIWRYDYVTDEILSEWAAWRPEL
ncbi:WD40-repeat-containing domain protein [Gamsiella multidivaricata]|uniref:WD40-repeat-containing domain protein n=1 Tax=Gamsiella multidivaricata TaxID=101098 RepID=UPI00221EB0B0|nr:WD40-repeat-containing domain protein [Gamsiella multidivaricata]KAI7827957.1 WD40-repeat-containing domain protein [Gamsiella multidivaricata]